MLAAIAQKSRSPRTSQGASPRAGRAEKVCVGLHRILWLTPERKLMDVREIAGAVGNYLKDHPEELWRLLRNALAMRFGVPLAALRWLAVKGGGQKAPKDLEIESVPPGVRLG